MEDVAEWQAYYAREPWGTELPYLGTAQIAAQVANSVPRKSAKIFTTQDFIPSFEPPREQTPEEMLAAFDRRADLINKQLAEAR